MSNNTEQKIFDYYYQYGVHLGISPKASSRDVGFDIKSGKELIGLFKKNEILIQGIELYKKKEIQYDPYDFWYQGNSLEENYSLIGKYLSTIEDTSEYYINIRPFDSLFKEKLDSLIYEKFGDLDSTPPPIGKSFE